MPTKVKVLRRIGNVILVLCAIAQLAAIVSPWWIVEVEGNYVQSSGIFYTVRCFREDCNVSSIHEKHSNRKVISYTGVITLEEARELPGEDNRYHVDIQKAVFVMSSFMMTILVTIAQFCITPDTLRGAVSANIMSFTAGLMVCVVSNDAVTIAFMQEVRDLDSRRDHTYVAFPISLVIYIVGVVLGFLSVACLIVNTFLVSPRSDDNKADTRYMIEPARRVDADDELDYEVEPERKIGTADPPPVYHIETTLGGKLKGEDNLTFSEKL